MKPVKLFYQERCPFCKKALRYIEELKAEYPEFQPHRSRAGYPQLPSESRPPPAPEASCGKPLRAGWR